MSPAPAPSPEGTVVLVADTRATPVRFSGLVITVDIFDGDGSHVMRTVDISRLVHTTKRMILGKLIRCVAAALYCLPGGPLPGL